jgi:hypothetical protein
MPSFNFVGVRLSPHLGSGDNLFSIPQVFQTVIAGFAFGRHVNPRPPYPANPYVPFLVMLLERDSRPDGLLICLNLGKDSNRNFRR